MNVNLYPEMNQKIVQILRISDEPSCQYAADLIESLQAQLAKEERRAEKAVEDLNTLRKKSRWTCFACKYDASYVREICAGCGYNDNWEWRGDAEDGENETTVAYFTLCKDNELGDVYRCASCGNEMYGNMPKYCSDCGKRIVEGDAE